MFIRGQEAHGIQHNYNKYPDSTRLSSKYFCTSVCLFTFTQGTLLVSLFFRKKTRATNSNSSTINANNITHKTPLACQGGAHTTMVMLWTLGAFPQNATCAIIVLNF